MVGYLKRYCYVLLIVLCTIFQSFSQNLDSLKSAYELAEEDTLKVNGLLNIANFFRGKNSDSLAYYAKASIQLAKEFNHPRGLGNGHELLGIAHLFKAEFDSAWNHLDIAIKQFEELSWSSKILNVKYLQGLVLFRQHQYDRAIIFFDELVSYGKRYNDPINTSKGFLMKGVIYSNTGNPTRALDAYYRSLAIEDSLNNVSIQAMLFNNIGILHQEQNELEKAQEIFKRSLDITPKEHSTHRGNLMLSLATVYHDAGQLDSAFYYANEAKKNLPVDRRSIRNCWCLCKIGHTF